ncbi:MAG: zinc metallopeptidase [Anaerolineales bacterium]|jgi:Zn-dependent membrane protease YugP
MFFSINYYIYMLPAIFLMMIAQWYVNSAYNKWGKIRNQRNITGSEAAERLIRSARLHDLQIERIRGNLTDHYDPSSKTLRLSQGVADAPSVAALAIAAHELGHAQQDQDEYLPLKFRAALVPMVNIGSYLGWIFIFGGLLLKLANLSWLGIAFFSGGALFALATLPVELNASARARKMLAETGLVTSPEETNGVRKVLNAAALTYVAGLFQAVMQLLYFVSLVSGGRRRS